MVITRIQVQFGEIVVYTKQKLKLYEAKLSMILIIVCTIISKADENACNNNCLLIMQFLQCS